jgi:hypothetical protein
MGQFRGVELADVELAAERLTLRRWPKTPTGCTP